MGGACTFQVGNPTTRECTLLTRDSQLGSVHSPNGESPPGSVLPNGDSPLGSGHSPLGTPHCAVCTPPSGESPDGRVHSARDESSPTWECAVHPCRIPTRERGVCTRPMGVHHWGLYTPRWRSPVGSVPSPSGESTLGNAHNPSGEPQLRRVPPAEIPIGECTPPQ